MRSTLIIISLLLGFSVPAARAQVPPVPQVPVGPAVPAVENRPEPDEPEQVPTPYEAVKLAAADLETISPDAQGYQRYFLTYDRSKEFYGAFNYVLNSCLSHASTLYRPPVIADGWLIRVDIRRLWPRKEDYEALFPEFEKLAQIDPYFHVTGELVIQEKVLVNVPRYKASDGKFYTQKWDVKEVKKFGTEHALHLLGPDAEQAPIYALVKSCNSEAPILRADWFMYIVSSQDPRDNGKYYTFRRIKNSDPDDEKKTAEVLWLANQGVNYDTIQNIRSDQRLGIWRSRVTGSPRVIEYFFTSSTRPSIGPSAAFITRDWFVGKIDAKRHPIKNLLNYDHDGTEAMGFLPNGMISWVLFDSDGALVDIAPQELVTDRTVPAPYPTNLQPPISCWRCHYPTDMWMPASNDILALSKGKLGLNFFDDESDKETPEDTLDRLTGLYAGEADEALRLVGNTHAKATFIVTGGMQVTAVGTKISEVYNVYRYGPVTPRQACLELGWRVSDAQALELFNQILPKLPPNRFGVRPESVTIGTLRAWTDKNQLNVNRDDWEQEYADAMLRVITESVRLQVQQAQESQK